MKISLAGQWLLNSPKYHDLPFTVPGSVLTALMEHHLIQDPYYRDNEETVREVLYDDYTFSKTFSLTKRQLAATNYLCFDGIDTVAEIAINGHPVASVRDMHTPRKIRLNKEILSEENEIRVSFTSPYKYIEAYPDNGLFETFAVTQKKSPVIRKPNYMLGWDWAPDLGDMSIVRDISIWSTEVGYLEDFRHTVTFQKDGSAKIDLEFNVEQLCTGTLCAELSLTDAEAPYNKAQRVALAPHTELSFTVEKPKRWNPIGYGEPTLYNLLITLTGEGGETQTYRYRLGLREVEIENKKDEIGTSFVIRINGNNIFLAGASYVPEDNILARIHPERTRALLQQAKDFGHNTVRVWGGGYYPTEDFYDYCDENGILVWQDLMFACAVYNIYDTEFRDMILEETAANVKRFRHHASVFIISGDNECEDGVNGHAPELMECYRKMSLEMIVPLMKTLTDTHFARTSPHSAVMYCHQNDLEHFDTHYWRVWGEERPLDVYETIYPRLLSEVGHSGFPSMETIRGFAAEEDLATDSVVMNAHQKVVRGNSRIMWYVREEYGEPKCFEDAAYLSQVTNAEAMRLCTEQVRRHRDICSGVIYWQLNDSWPCISGSSIDYYGRPKALHYASKRFFAPHFISVGLAEDNLEVYITNDSPKDTPYCASVQVQRFDGTVLWEKAISTTVKAACSGMVLTLPRPEKPDAVVCVSLFSTDGTLLCENFRQLKKDREISYPAPHYTVTQPDETHLELSVDTFTKHIYVYSEEPDVIFSDNFFTLRKGGKILLTANRPFKAERLHITSVNETQNH